MAKFKPAYLNTKKWEGGYTGNADDNGNWTGAKKGVGKLIGTNKGITAWRLKEFLGRMPTVDEMKHIDEATVMAIYKKHYWLPVRGDEILEQSVANSIYDSCVNMGAKQAIKLAQRALGIAETGKLDDFTLGKLNNTI